MVFEWLSRIFMPSQLGRDIANSLRAEPLRWRDDDTYTTDRDDGLCLWTRNGRSFISVYKPCKIELSFADKWIIAKALRSRFDGLSLDELMKL